jgi:hypothetical protein
VWNRVPNAHITSDLDLTTHPTHRDSCGLYTILYRGQTATGNDLTTHPSHRDSCGLFTILYRGQTATGNDLTTHPSHRDSCGLYTSSPEDKQPQVTTS